MAKAAKERLYRLDSALVYFNGPWENILALGQYIKIILFQITNNTNLTRPYLTLPGATKGHPLHP